jgi:hypothetical protein
MQKKKGECPCSEHQADAGISARGPMKISPDAYQLLRDVPIPSEFREVVREVKPDIGMVYLPNLEESPSSFRVDKTSIEMPKPQVSIPPVEIPVATVPVSLPVILTSDSGVQAFYLTDLTLDLTGVAHMTPGLFAHSLASLAPFVTNNLACCPPQEDGKGEGEEQAVTARFSSARIVTGYTVPEDTSTIKSDSVTLTVTPKRLAANVDLRIAGKDRATVVEIQRNPVAGTVTFRVKGKSATPADKKEGDTTVEAVVGGRVLATTKVVVVIPKAIATPHPTFDGEVNGVNMVISATSKPAATPASLKALKRAYPNRDVFISTAYLRILTITVNDQFGDELDAIYAGTQVTEEGDPINQQMTANGTYSDPVGHLVNFAYHSQNGADAYAAKEPLEPAPNHNESVNKGVEVGGHSLNPAIVNRTVTLSPKPGSPMTGQLKITWPD